MGFKKPNKVKKKSKGSTNKRDDWTFDGITNKQINSSDDSNQFKGPRHTQEKDEKYRRSRVKHELMKRKGLVVNKLKNKVKFSDYLFDNKETAEDHKSKDKNNQIDIQPFKKPTIRNDKPVVERLLELLTKSKSRNIKYDDEYVSDNDNSDNDSDLQDNEELEKDNYDINTDDNNTNINKISDNSSLEELEPIDDDIIEDNDDDVDENKEVNNSNYHIMFSSNELKDDKSKINTIIGDNIEITGQISTQVTIHNINTYKDIPILHKMWKLRQSESINSFGKVILPYLTTYVDTFIEGRNHHNDHDIFFNILIHACTHAVKSRSITLKHNQRIKQKVINNKINNIDNNNKSNKLVVNDNENDYSNNYHDQGYARPRILILCPFRSVALNCVNNMIDIFGKDTTSITNYDKFINEYSSNDSNTSNQNFQPDDWLDTFQNKNTDDDFKLGIQINPGKGKSSKDNQSIKGVHMRLYSDFTISDIILISPLGLRLLLDKNIISNDILSSLEMIIIHQLDIIYMQNIDNINLILEKCNQIPKNYNENIDFSRVRPYFLESKDIIVKHKQLIITSNFNEPFIQSIYKQNHHSLSGYIKLKCYNSNEQMTINHVVNGIEQIFHLIPTNNILTQLDNKFTYFCKHILHQIIRSNQNETLIVTPSYFDFIRVRNELIRQEVDAVFISEYSRESEISRGRSRFFHGQKKILLYSGRAHFFRRFKIRGASHLIFYSLPEYAHYYSEIANFLNDKNSIASDKCTCTVLFTKYEQMSLERIVGKQRALLMLSSKTNIFKFK